MTNDTYSGHTDFRYLGWLPPGSGERIDLPQVERIRYAAINPDARRILNVPRVLSYLRDKDDFSSIRKACDVYDYAVGNLISDGIRDWTLTET